MADNVTVDNGAGTDYTPATDEVTHSGDTAHIQLVRPVAVTGSEGAKSIVEIWKAEDAGHSSGDLGAMMLGVRNDANATRAGTDGDYVPPSMDAAGNQNVIARRGTTRIAVSSGGLTIATTAYTAGDQVGTQFTIAGAARASGGTGRIKSVVLLSDADIIGAYDVVFTRASITLASDNAAYAISDADSLNVIGIVQLAGAFDIGNNRVAQAYNLDIPYDCSGGTSLYAGLITRVGHTFFAATDDLTLVVFVELD